MPKARLIFDGDWVYTEKEARIHKLTQETETKIDNIPGIVDDVNSTSTTDALSANMGKYLQDQINNISWTTIFLSTWDCTTGLPETDPAVDPYTYKTWNYYIVWKVASSGWTNYRPHGATYTHWVPSTSVETQEINVNDWYIYDWQTWVIQPASTVAIVIDDMLKPNSTNAVENRAIYSAVSQKQDRILDLAEIRAWAAAWASWLQPWDNITELVNNAWYQTAWDVAVAIEWCKYVWPTAPSNPTEGMLWYDTTNDQLKVYDWTQWNVTWKEYVAWTGINISWTTISNTWVISSNNTYNNVIHLTQAEYDALQNKDPNTLYSTPDWNDISVVSNEAYSANWDWINTIAPSKNAVYDKLESDLNTKIFYLPGITWADSLAAAQAIVDWVVEDNNRTALIRLYTDVTFTLVSTWIKWKFTALNPNITNNSSWWYSYMRITEIDFNLENGRVVSIDWVACPISPNVLATDYDYSVPYTPQYNGSPATKKYVDDTVSSATEWSKYVWPSTPSNPTEGMLWYDTTNDILKVYNWSSWDEVWSWDGDMSYDDFNFQTKTWATITLDLTSVITPSANFTVNAPSSIKDWQTYILRVSNWTTAYTMTLGTNITNPYDTDITLTPNWIDQFVFLAIWWNLELQPDASEIKLKTIGWQSIEWEWDIDVNAIIWANVAWYSSSFMWYSNARERKEWNFLFFTASSTTNYFFMYTWMTGWQWWALKLLINETEYSIPESTSGNNFYMVNLTAWDKVYFKITAYWNSNYNASAWVTSYVVFWP